MKKVPLLALPCERNGSQCRVLATLGSPCGLVLISLPVQYSLHGTMCITMPSSLQFSVSASSIEPVSNLITHLLRAKDLDPGTLTVPLRSYIIHTALIIPSSPRILSQHVLHCPPCSACRQRICKRPSSTDWASSKRHSGSFMGSLQLPKSWHQRPAALCLRQRVHM